MPLMIDPGYVAPPGYYGPDPHGIGGTQAMVPSGPGAYSYGPPVQMQAPPSLFGVEGATPFNTGLAGITGDPHAHMAYHLEHGNHAQNVAYALRRLALLAKLGLAPKDYGIDPLNAYRAASGALTMAAHSAGYDDPRQYLIAMLKRKGAVSVPRGAVVPGAGVPPVPHGI